MKFGSLFKGQSLVEYVILLAAVTALITVPLNVPGAHGRTAAVYLVDSIRAFFESLTFFLSLP
ncbi:MAG: hypothetical protein ACK53K_09440 [Burkholderiales bacterium]|jgi:hypothetical protein